VHFKKVSKHSFVLLYI